MPTYLRRSAINTATGCYSSYYSNLKNWEENPIGKKPRLQLDRNVMPSGIVIYNDTALEKFMAYKEFSTRK